MRLAKILDATQRPVFFFLGLLVLAVTLCGCQDVFKGFVPMHEEAPPGSVILKVPQLPNMAAPDIENLAAQAVVAEFKKKYPHIILRGASPIKIEGNQMDYTILLSIAGGTASDVIYVNFRNSGVYVQKGFLAPLDEFIDQGGAKVEVPEKVKEVVYREDESGKKHWFALPTGPLLIRALFYRRDHFARVGLDPEKPPRTWDELLTTCRTLQKLKGEGILPLGSTVGIDEGWMLFPFLGGAGAHAMAQNEKGEWRASFNSPQALQAFDFYRQLAQEGILSRDTDFLRRWSDGRLSMLMLYVSGDVLCKVDPNVTGIAPIPLGPANRTGAEMNCEMHGIFSGVKDPAVKKAAWDYIQFLNSEEAALIKARVFVENGYAQYMDPDLLKKLGYAGIDRQIPPLWKAAYEDGKATGNPEPFSKGAKLIYETMSTPLSTIVTTRFDGLSDAERLQRIQAILDEGVVSANERLVGYIEPKKEQLHTLLAWFVVIPLFGGFLWVIRRIWKVFTPAHTVDQQWRFWHFRWAYLLLVPAVGLIVLWSYYPIFRGSQIAFQNYQLLGASNWVGLKNFGNVLFDHVFWIALRNSMVYTGLLLGIGFFAPILLAILLQEIPRGKLFFRTIFYLPAVISGIVVLFLWKEFYAQNGILNQLLAGIGIHVNFNWLQHPNTAMIAVVIPTVWAGLGAWSLIYQAALKSIPDELYEAADIDGAGHRHKIFYIIFPYLKPLIVINFMGSFIAAIQGSGGNILLMTGGGPGLATNVLGFEIFKRSFLHQDFGPATSMAWLLGSLVIGFTMHQLRMLSRMEYRAVDPGKAAK